MNSRLNLKAYRWTAERAEDLLKFNTKSRLPVILQTENAECGLVCLAMIASYYGYQTDMNSIRRKFSISNHGAGLRHLMEVASNFCLAPRAVKAEIDSLSQVKLPCVLHWNLNHFVVLKAIKKSKYIIHDPSIGERTLDKSSFSNEFTGIALELTPTEDFKRVEDKQQLKISHFWSSISGLKRNLFQLLILSFVLQLFAIAAPFYMQTVVDDVLLRQDRNLLIVLAMGFGLLMLIQTGTSALREIIILRFSNRFGMQISSNLYRHLIRLPMEYFSKRHMGDVVSRFGSLNKVRSLLTNGLIAAVVDGAMAIITLLAMALYDFRLTLIVVGIALIYAGLRWALYNPFRILMEESISASATESTHFMETVRAVQTVKLFECENDRQHQWQNCLAHAMNKDIAIARYGISYNTINSILFGLENILIVYFAALAVMDSIMTLGMLYAFMSYKDRFIKSMDSLISQWIEFKMLGVHLNRLADIVFTDVEVPYNKEIEQIQARLVGKIEVKNLSFRYGKNDKYVFQNINFTIFPGETVAITGPSGCGKTTLLKCIMGLLTPTDGEIFIDDKPLKSFVGYRSQIAAVMQEDQLLSGDIAENIACFSTEINYAKVIECAEMACIHDEIQGMTMNYQTLVGDMGASLSGGQKQRIILARALYRNPSILFMDEATSHLDVNSEKQVNAKIKNMSLTRVLVAHRPETVKSAQREICLVGN